MIRPIRNAPKIDAIPICCAVIGREQDGDEDDPEPERRHLPDLVVRLRDAAEEPPADDEEHGGERRGQQDHLDRVRRPCRVPATAVASASRPQAVTSSIAALARASAPTGRFEHPPLGQDPRQHRERRDRHRDAHEERERQVADVAATSSR